MNDKTKKTLFLLMMVLLFANLVYGMKFYEPKDNEENGIQNIKIFVEVLKKVRKNYVDQDKVTYKKLIYGSLKGMLKSLDKHSNFMPPATTKQLNEQMSGQFGGVGIVVSMEKNKLTVIHVIEDGPSYKAGLKQDDIIVAINTMDVFAI